MADSKIAVVYEGSFGHHDGHNLVLDRWGSSMFMSTHNDRLVRTNLLLERIDELCTGTVGGALADCYGMPQHGVSQNPRRKSDKEMLAQARELILSPVTQASGMLLVKSAIDFAARTEQEDGAPALLDVDSWVDVAFAQKNADNSYVHFPDDYDPGYSDWFAAMTGEPDVEMQRKLFSIVCGAVVELPDFNTPQQLAYRGTLATFYRFDNTPTPYETQASL